MRCRRGEHEAMCMAYDKVWRLIYPGVYQIVRNREEAEDVLQESIIKGFERLNELKEPEKYPGWQKQIALRQALNRIRSGRNAITFMEVTEVSDEETADIDWMNISMEQVMRKLDSLADGYRVVIRLYLMEDWSHEEIGKHLGITASTSRSQYSRAMLKLKKELQEEYAKQV